MAGLDALVKNIPSPVVTRVACAKIIKQFRIESIEPEVDLYRKRQVKITAAGPMQFFKAAETAIALQENQRTDLIVENLIGEVVIPPALSSAWV